MFALADRWGRPLSAVLELTTAEFVCWLAWCRLSNKQAEGK